MKKLAFIFSIILLHTLTVKAQNTQPTFSVIAPATPSTNSDIEFTFVEQPYGMEPNYELVNFAKNIVANSKDVKIVLIGTAVNKNTRKPLDNTLIILESTVGSPEKLIYTTKEDGSFFFKLNFNKKYSVSLISSAGSAPEDVKVVSTIGKKNSEIINIILQGSPTEKQEQVADWSVKKSAPKASSMFAFKVQLGAFKNPLNPSHSYLKDVQGQVSVETETGLYKYLVGEFSDPSAAKSYCNDLISRGYANALVVTYQGKKRLNMKIDEVMQTYFK